MGIYSARSALHIFLVWWSAYFSVSDPSLVNLKSAYLPFYSLAGEVVPWSGYTAQRKRERGRGMGREREKGDGEGERERVGVLLMELLWTYIYRPTQQEPTETTNQSSLFRSRDWLSANQGPEILWPYKYRPTQSRTTRLDIITQDDHHVLDHYNTCRP
eukprot:sb/3472974/